MPGGRGLIQINDSVPELAQHIQTLSEAKRGRTAYDHVNLVPWTLGARGKAVVNVAVETGDPADVSPSMRRRTRSSSSSWAGAAAAT